MHSVVTPSDTLAPSFVRFGQSHGYRLDGDAALLNAQIDVDTTVARGVESLALQLWACQEPYRGGPLTGFKVAEAPIFLSALEAAGGLATTAFARPPALEHGARVDTREYSMVLVLAAGSGGIFDQVHDFANYPARQRFLGPQIEGAAGYRLSQDKTVSIQVDRVVNTRASENLSGTLSLQLWALAEPYRGGELRGTLLASQELAPLSGQCTLSPGELHCVLNTPRDGERHVLLALCEWTSAGYLPRDYCNFIEAYRGPESSPAIAAPELVAAPVPAREQELAAAPDHAPVRELVAAPVPVHVREAVAAPERVPEEVVSAPVPARVPEANAAPVPAPEQPEKARPSLNTASAEELARVAGISLKLASLLIKARPFKSFEQLRTVRGIGDRTVQNMRKTFVL
jgi:hypothetical protein